ncbi:MAG: pyridoxal-phosphate dependent enzyme [Deltaproteobacteria bacterium]|nr:pyridoxal-phosphate dependent enzyme [Deltaproteobacteria bacterium]
MIDLTVNEEQIKAAVQRARERNIVIPTFKQQRDPSLIPDAIKNKLKNVGLWDVDPLNLFRITWKNEPKEKGGLFGKVNYIEFPPELTGVKARIIALVGKYFPTGAHKVGATFGCLVPALVTGQFDPIKHKAVWPSTGNYCRGGAYDAALLGCQSIAILPEEMSRERFDWLKSVAGEVIATPGCESNVKEIFDKCWELQKTRSDIVIFNQFDQQGNHLWHYTVTGPAMVEVLEEELGTEGRVRGIALASGSGGTLGCADYVKEQFPEVKLAVSEALQCPTLLLNGFGGHRIEGIGDKHVPWIHNVRNTDMIVAVDDEDTMRIMRMFNEPAGRSYLKKQGVDPKLVDQLDLLGISGIGNLISAIKMAKYYELEERDVVLTVLTDSMELYGTRVKELNEQDGAYSDQDAAADYHGRLLGAGTDNLEELTHYGRKRVHNLKYYTWIEQQAKQLDELNAQWSPYPDYWEAIHQQVEAIDERIVEFNRRTGLAD